MTLRSDLFDFQPAHAESLIRVCGLQGPSPSWLSREIQPSISVVDMEDPQYRWLSRTGQFAMGNNTPAQAGQSSVFMLAPSVGQSAKIARLRRLILSAAVGQSISCSVISLDTILPVINLQTVIQGGPLDARQVGAQGAIYQGTFGTSLAGFSPRGIYVPLQAASIFMIDDLGITLARGGAFYVAGNTLNLAFNVSVTWDERECTTAELG